MWQKCLVYDEFKSKVITELTFKVDKLDTQWKHKLTYRITKIYALFWDLALVQI